MGDREGRPYRGSEMTNKSDIHHRRSIRLQGYDYSRAGAYFITICTQNRECLFGDIADGKIALNPFGEIATGQWRAIPDRFPDVGTDEFVVMPNHIHGIVIIDVGATLAVALPLAGDKNTTNESCPLTPDGGVTGTVNRATGTNNRATARVAPTIGNIVGAYKSICYRECLAWINNHERGRRLDRLWQRNYWEHVIRNEMELSHIREYIRNNPARWEGDRLNPRGGDPHNRPSSPAVREPDVTYANEGWMV